MSEKNDIILGSITIFGPNKEKIKDLQDTLSSLEKEILKAKMAETYKNTVWLQKFIDFVRINAFDKACGDCIEKSYSFVELIDKAQDELNNLRKGIL